MIVRVVGSGRPLVALHGFGVDHRIMLPLDDMVGDAPWRRVYVDFPWAAGQGPTTVASTAEVCAQLLDDLRAHLGDEPFAVVGNSFGGMVARAVAHERRAQVLGLATLAGVVVARHRDRLVPPPRVVRSDPGVLDAAGDARDDFAANTAVHTSETLAAFSAFVQPGLADADEATMNRIARAYALPVEPEAAHPAPFEAPSLHVFGRQDAVVGYEDGWGLRAHYPRGTFAVLDAAGHNVHLEQPALVGALVREWLGRIDATPTP